MKKSFYLIAILLTMSIAANALFPVPQIFAADEAGHQETQKVEIQAGGEAGCSWYQVFCHLRKFLNWSVLTIGYIIGRSVAFFIIFAAGLITVLIQITSTITSNPFVLEGFKISLNLANLGFVLGIILMAFVTILRIESYEMKQTLRNLIIAAVLINFSFAIAGVLIDFTNALGNFFINATSVEGGGAKQFAENFANALNLNASIPAPIENAAGSVLTFGETFLKSVVSVIAMIVFGAMTAIIFWGYAIMLAIRTIYVGILLILMPLAWLFLAIPNLTYLWSKWWDKFLQWTFFFPGAAFFLYLAILAQQKVGATQIPLSDSAANLAGWSESVYGKMMELVLQIGIMVGGLIAANSMGIHSADGALKAAKAVKGWAIGAVGKYTGARAAVRGAAAAGAVAGRPTARGLSNLLNSPLVRWMPGVKGAANKLAGLGYGSRKEEIDEYTKNNLSNLTPDQIKSRLKGQLPLGAIAKSALFKRAAELNLLNEADPNNRKAMLEAIKVANPAMPTDKINEIKEMASIDPKLVAEFTSKTVKETVDSLNPQKAVENLSASYLEKNVDVIAALNKSQLGAFKRGGSDAQLTTIEQHLKKQIGENFFRINEAMIGIKEKLKEARDIDDQPQIKALASQLKARVNEFKSAIATEAQQSAYKQWKIFNQTIGDIS